MRGSDELCLAEPGAAGLQLRLPAIHFDLGRTPLRLRRRRRGGRRFVLRLGPLVEDLLQELLGGVGPDVAVGLRVEQRLLERARTRAGHVLHAAADPAEQRLAVVRRWRRAPRRAPRAPWPRRRPRTGPAPVPARRAPCPLRLGGRLEQRHRVGRALQLHERLGGDEARLDADVALVNRVNARQILHRVLVALLVVGEAAERVRGADERLRLGLAEGVLDAVGAQLLRLRFAAGQHDAQLFFGPLGVSGRQARHPDSDVRVGQVGVDRQRRAELLLGGARAALLEQTPALGHMLLRVRCDDRRHGGLLVGGEVTLLVLLPEPQGQRRCARWPRGACAPAPDRPRRLRGLRWFVLLGGGGGGLGRLSGLPLLLTSSVVADASVLAGDGTIP